MEDHGALPIHREGQLRQTIFRCLGVPAYLRRLRQHLIPANNIQLGRTDITSHDCEGRKASPETSQRYCLTCGETPDFHIVG